MAAMSADMRAVAAVVVAAVVVAAVVVAAVVAREGRKAALRGDPLGVVLLIVVSATLGALLATLGVAP